MKDETENKQHLCRLIEAVRDGRLSRRQVVQQMVRSGLGVPTAAALLLQAGVARGQTGFAYKPTRRGGGGTLCILS